MLLELFVTLLIAIIVRSELFSSLASMKSMIGAEGDIPVMINSYVAKEMERLNELKRFADEVEKHNDLAIKHGEVRIINPLNAFLLIREMSDDWNNAVELLRMNPANEFIKNLTERRISEHIVYPSGEDLAGAANGILRLQDTYRLSTKDLANGKILNSKLPTSPLTASDCFEIARIAYNNYDYYHTIMWMQEAKERVEEEAEPTVNLEDIIEYLAYALYKQGNVKRALQFTDKLCEMNPEHPRAKGNVKWYEDMLEHEGLRLVDWRRNIPPLINMRHDDGLEHSERDIYEALCRNEVPTSIKAQSLLYSYYKIDRPYLRLAPIKVQIMRFNPLAVLFIDIMSDEESSIIEMLAIPKLNRATVQNSKTGKLEFADYRISKSAWLKTHEHEVVERLNRRLELATNLEMETAEELQIQNYGVGGHYDPHFDCARKEETNAFKDLGTGNRIATILVYMTVPEYGGGTVFTDVKTSVSCTKNAALFWYNLLRSGEVDVRSRHAACPVLTGVKWVTNKWIHERGQEWRRPCGLHQFDQERYIGDLGGPEPRNHPNIQSIP